MHGHLVMCTHCGRLTDRTDYCPECLSSKDVFATEMIVDDGLPVLHGRIDHTHEPWLET